MSFVPGIATTATRGRCFVVHAQTLAVIEGTNELPVGDVDADWVYFGDLDGEPCFAKDAPTPLPGTVPTSLRALYGALPDETFAVALRALGLGAWDRDHRFCGRCGGETVRATDERVRTCAKCRFGSYPRISPAVIVRVTRDDKILLARNARSTTGFHSVLAGFVEVGETLEATVHRELHEEVGVAVEDVRYFGSQPWSFTNSLMIAFTARWAGGELAPDGNEILEAGWFTRDALPIVPPALSIARQLIDDFVTLTG